jgi:hypothetical protein
MLMIAFAAWSQVTLAINADCLAYFTQQQSDSQLSQAWAQHGRRQPRSRTANIKDHTLKLLHLEACLG